MFGSIHYLVGTILVKGSQTLLVNLLMFMDVCNQLIFITNAFSWIDYSNVTIPTFTPSSQTSPLDINLLEWFGRFEPTFGYQNGSWTWPHHLEIFTIKKNKVVYQQSISEACQQNTSQQENCIWWSRLGCQYVSTSIKVYTSSHLSRCPQRSWMTRYKWTNALYRVYSSGCFWSWL